MKPQLLGYYQALEQASIDMLNAARQADWKRVVNLEGACVLLIAQLKQAMTSAALSPVDVQEKGRLMQRILFNDGEIRNLAELRLEEFDRELSATFRTLH